MHYENILEFWLIETKPTQWWNSNSALDQLIARRFGAIHRSATACELYSWRTTARGRLAEIIVLDQFSRNIHRNTPAAFASDAMALALAQEAVAAGVDQKLSAVERSFVYMPYMHSESLAIHDLAVDLFRQNGIASNLDVEIRHKEIIERFDRYPHRNSILGRKSTEEETEFLRQPGSRF